MDFGKLRRFDVQAKYALVLAVLSAGPLLGAIVLTVRNFESELGRIVYQNSSMWLPAFLACLGSCLLMGVLGLLLGWSSAGQRRNDKSTWSWTGFFVGGMVTTFGTVLLVAFVMLRQSI